MSTNKKACENYLFEDYALKDCIEGQISGITLSEEATCNIWFIVDLGWGKIVIPTKNN